jgi:hypothetical protein
MSIPYQGDKIFDRNFCARLLRGLPKKIGLERILDDFALDNPV